MGSRATGAPVAPTDSAPALAGGAGACCCVAPRVPGSSLWWRRASRMPAEQHRVACCTCTTCVGEKRQDGHERLCSSGSRDPHMLQGRGLHSVQKVDGGAFEVQQISVLLCSERPGWPRESALIPAVRLFAGLGCVQTQIKTCTDQVWMHHSAGVLTALPVCGWRRRCHCMDLKLRPAQQVWQFFQTNALAHLPPPKLFKQCTRNHAPWSDLQTFGAAWNFETPFVDLRS